MTKQDEVMFHIVKQIVSGEKEAGMMILRNDYELNSKQMAIVFKKFMDNDIIERPFHSIYIATEKCKENAQEFCLKEIVQRLKDIENIANIGNISEEMLVECIRIHLSERKHRVISE